MNTQLPFYPFPWIQTPMSGKDSDHNCQEELSWRPCQSEECLESLPEANRSWHHNPNRFNTPAIQRSQR